MVHLSGRDALFLLLILGSLVLSTVGWYHLRHQSYYQFVYSDIKKLTEVRGKVFVNEKVLLDGYHYTFCRFQNVTFIYNGVAPTALDNNEIAGYNVQTDNPALLQNTTLLKGLGMLKPDIPVTTGPDRTPINVQPPKVDK
jgi:hypothetical protein